MRLTVFHGAVGAEEVRLVTGALGEKDDVTVVAKSVLPDAEQVLTHVAEGSHIRKAQRDLRRAAGQRARRITRSVEETV